MKQTNTPNTEKDISANDSDGSHGRHRMSYRDVNMHKVMLQDIVRTEAYQRSLNETLKTNHTVLDFGCGSGVLSMFASSAGAKEVLAVDRSPFIKNAQNIAKANGFENIHFYHDDHESLQLDGTVDVIVSEWMGHCLFYEAMLEPLLRLRDRYLTDNGLMIPAKVSLHLGLVHDEEIMDDLCFLQDKPYGIDFSPIAGAVLQQSDLVALEPESILESVADMGTLDMHSITKADAPRVFFAKLIPSEEATIYALCAWFSTELSEGVAFGTGPNDRPTHWDQLLLPLPTPFKVSPARELSLCLSPQTEKLGEEQTWLWSISDGVNTIEVDEKALQQSAPVMNKSGRLPD
jgi:SAM-dependent methyltransferase